MQRLRVNKIVEVLGGMGRVRIKKIFPVTISHKIFDTNSSFHVKYRTRGKVLLLFFATFLVVLTQYLFEQGDRALGYHSLKFRHFPNIS